MTLGKILKYLVLLTGCFALVFGDPQACTYTETTNSYECNAHNWALPLQLTQFNNTPQVLSLVQVNGELPSSAPSGPTFDGFEGIDNSTFDTNYVPSLHIRCASTGQLILTSGSFSNMSYIKELRFFDCMILNLADTVFSELVELNYLSFDGGSVSNIGFDAFLGLNIYPMDVPNPMGALAFRNAQITSSGLPNGALYNLVNITKLIIENSALRVLQPDMFKKSTKLTYISLDKNPFTKITEGLFADLPALTVVSMRSISWDCTCPQLWFEDYFTTNNISMIGDIICDTPSDYYNKRSKQYDLETCVQPDACGDVPGIANGETCVTYWDITAYCLHPFAVVMAAVALGLSIYTRRQLDFVKEDRQGTRPQLGLRKLSGSGWKGVVSEKPTGGRTKVTPKSLAKEKDKQGDNNPKKLNEKQNNDSSTEKETNNNGETSKLESKDKSDVIQNTDVEL
ncbi:reticulon-4 receptor-like 2 [Ylistrum balloti]|uniref:reticulon-4 receptor-like 2 n=1 Tax=Ylistrum balloti TaxID=509963 RepID=UPI002905E16F|nr:reticulon-4 receptor-like 2 [Ylistrum balloti]